MKTASAKPSHYELLLKAYDKALATYERTKTDEKAAKHYYKNAMKDTSKSDLEILELEYERIKYRRKSRKVSLKIAKIRLKVWAKTHDEEVKVYQLSETAMEEAMQKETQKAEKKAVKDKKAVKAVKVKAVKDVKVKAAKDVKVKAAKDVKVKGVKDVKIRKVKKAPKIILIKEVKENIPTITKSTEKATEPKPQKPPRKPRRSSAEVQAEKAANKQALGGDNFSIIEGIGEKVTQTLHAGGIHTFAQLAAADYETLKGIMRAAKNRLATPATWAEQAKLVIENKFEELKALQNTLKGGRKVQ